MNDPQSTENDLYRQRLLNVARALRESPAPDKFTMDEYFKRNCGTPACALGHYTFREDLQSVFWWDKKGRYPISRATGEGVSYDESEVLAHFGLTENEADELFGAEGCGWAQEAVDAADFIENFVKHKYGSAT